MFEEVMRTNGISRGTLEVGFVERACRARKCAVVRCATTPDPRGGLMEVRLTFESILTGL